MLFHKMFRKEFKLKNANILAVFVVDRDPSLAAAGFQDKVTKWVNRYYFQLKLKI